MDKRGHFHFALTNDEASYRHRWCLYYNNSGIWNLVLKMQENNKKIAHKLANTFIKEDGNNLKGLERRARFFGYSYIIFESIDSFRAVIHENHLQLLYKQVKTASDPREKASLQNKIAIYKISPPEVSSEDLAQAMRNYFHEKKPQAEALLAKCCLHYYRYILPREQNKANQEPSKTIKK